MSLFYPKLSLPLLVVFGAVLFLIRSQPYNDRELRAVLLPNDCPMPCFMGIRPGVTTVDEAVKLLKASDWVDQVKITLSSYGLPDTVRWSWNGRQPDIFPFPSDDLMVLSYSGKPAQTVEIIRVNTSLPIGYAFLLLGDADVLQTGAAGAIPAARVAATYLDTFVNVWGVVACPISKRKFWDTTMVIDFTSAKALDNTPGFSDLNYFC